MLDVSTACDHAGTTLANQEGLEIEALAGFSGLVDEIISLLSGVIGNREQEFLDLGESLMRFTSRMGELTGKSSRLAEMTSGGDIQRGIESLNSQLDELGKACGLDSTESSMSELHAIGGVIRELNGRVDNFSRVVKKLTMLGISTRIESARLGTKGLGFATLADDVEKLAGKIVSNSGRIIQKSKSLSTLIDSVTNRTAELLRLQGEYSEKIVTDLNASLEGLKQMVERSDAAAANISERLSSIQFNVSEAVSSMQFHDIVRQQVEHVEEIFADAGKMIPPGGLVSGLEEREPGESGDEFLASETQAGRAKELICWLSDVSRLQKSQLTHAAERFAEAVANLIENLKNIGDNVMLLGKEMGGVLSGGRGGGHVLERIEAAASEIVSSLREFSAQGREISELMGGVAETIMEMSEFVSDIEEVGSEIELIALNASIKAAHTGEEGKALGVLAQSIQWLSMDAMELTGEVSNVLKEITDSSRKLEQRSSDYMVSEDLEKLVGRQEETTAELKKLNGEVAKLFEEVSLESKELGSDIAGLADGIVIHKEVCADLEMICGKAESLIRKARETAPDEDDAARSERLRDLLGRYTMEAERLVHKAAAEIRPVIPNECDESNIEMFDDGGAAGDIELFDGADVRAGEAGPRVEKRGRDASGNGGRGTAREEEWENVELF